MFSYQGKPLVERALELLRPHCSQLLISTNDAGAYQQFALPLLKDLYTGCGPLGGIYSALRHIHPGQAVVLACDMPSIPAPLIARLIAQADTYQAVIPVHGGYHETLCACYDSSCLPTMESSLKNGDFKIMNSIRKLHALFLDVSREPYYSKAIFHNINRPTDLNGKTDPPAAHNA